MEKAAEAFRTISEVATELTVPKHVLRFWESKFTQIKPMKRGGGRRYYRPDDVELLRGICRLLHDEGYTIKGVQKVIRQSGVDFVKQCWRQDETPAPAAAPMAAGRPKAAGKSAAKPKPEPKAGPKPEPEPKDDAKTKLSLAEGRGMATTRVLLLQKLMRELEACRDLLEAA